MANGNGKILLGTSKAGSNTQPLPVKTTGQLWPTKKG